MAKFAIECPKCGSINHAQTGLFAKKTIICVTCKEEFDIKATRMTSKVCPHCQKTFVYDQASGKNQKCPSCGKKLNAFQSETGKYHIERLNCPKCACSIEVDTTKETVACPVCNYTISVKQELEKAKLVNDTTVSVLQYEGNQSTFIWKHPIENFNSGSLLNVHESQEALFVVNGRILDVFGAGQHLLDADALPLLGEKRRIPTGGQSQFHAEVYFVNKSVHMGVKWGTDSRVNFIDPIAKVPLDIGACGELNLYVTDSRKLLTKLVGTASTLFDRQTLSSEDPNSKSLQSFFRAPMMTVIKSFLASEIVKREINILEIDQKLAELSEALLQHIAPVYGEYGLAVSHFYISQISLPEDSENFQEIRSLIASRYKEVERLRLQATLAQEERVAILEAKKTELERGRMDAELRILTAEAAAKEKLLLGHSEAVVMGEKGYTGKDELELEKHRAWAEGYGKAGSPPVEDPIEALSKLKKLLDAGLIEQAEYDAKKQEILKRL